MVAVIFEALPDPNHFDEYLAIAADLFGELEQIEGFISVERFSSLTTENKLLSLSFWEDEAAVQRWRQHLDHRQAQARGRSKIFTDYRLRVAAVMRDYGKFNREEAPAS